MPDFSGKSFIRWSCSQLFAKGRPKRPKGFLSRPVIREQPGTGEKNRDFSKIALEFIEFCPKSANFRLRQGINREISEIAAKLPDSKYLRLLFARFKKLTGKGAGNICPISGKLNPRRTRALIVQVVTRSSSNCSPRYEYCPTAAANPSLLPLVLSTIE